MQLVLRGNYVVDVEVGADLVRDQLAVRQIHPSLFVDVHPQQKRASLPPVLDVYELEPFGGNDLLDLLLHPFR